jgi:hypothetical protein
MTTMGPPCGSHPAERRELLAALDLTIDIVDRRSFSVAGFAAPPGS